MTTAELDASVSTALRDRPWLQRRIEASGHSLLAVGGLIATAQLASFFAWIALGWALGVGGPGGAFALPLLGAHRRIRVA
ncbi:MAG: hypothetical protein ACREI8_03935, partial [Myxococcota bacterium]